MRLLRIFAVCDGQSLGKTTLARLIHNAMPSLGSSLICIGTSRQQMPFLDSPLRSAYFDIEATGAIGQLTQVVRHHRVVVLDVETAKHAKAQAFLNDPCLLAKLGALQTHAMRLTPDLSNCTLQVRRPLADGTAWDHETQQIEMPSLPRGIRESLQKQQVTLPAALGEHRHQLDLRVRDWLGLWEHLCAPPLLKLLERCQPEHDKVPMANAV